MCCGHHDLHTYGGWALVPGTGKRPMVSPEDPRHPRNRGPTSGADPPGPNEDPVLRDLRAATRAAQAARIAALDAHHQPLFA